MRLQVRIVKPCLTLVEPVFAGLGLENLILISPQGNELVHLILDEKGNLQRVEQDTGVANSVIVAPFLSNRNVDRPPAPRIGRQFGK